MFKITLLVSSLILGTMGYAQHKSKDEQHVLALLRPQVLSEVEAKTHLNSLGAFAGFGYDVFSGNPLAEDKDRGWKRPIWKYTYDEKYTTSDKKYSIPLETFAQYFPKCKSSSETSSYTGAQGLQENLQVAVGLDVAYNGVVASASFQGSTEFQRSKNEQSSEVKKTYLSQAKCELYLVSVETDKPLLKSFQDDAVEAYRFEDWSDFLNTWGTHYTNQVSLGASIVRKATYTSKEVQTLESIGINVEAAVEASYLTVKGKVSTSVNYSKTQQDYLKSVSASKSAYYIGKGPNPDAADNMEKWIAEIGESDPAPLTFSLTPIETLFKPSRFRDYPDLNMQDFIKMKQTFVAAVTEKAKRYPPLAKDKQINPLKIKQLTLSPPDDPIMPSYLKPRSDTPLTTALLKATAIKYTAYQDVGGQVFFYGIGLVVSDGGQETDSTFFGLTEGNGNSKVKTFRFKTDRTVVGIRVYYLSEIVQGLQVVYDAGVGDLLGIANGCKLSYVDFKGGNLVGLRTYINGNNRLATVDFIVNKIEY